VRRAIEAYMGDDEATVRKLVAPEVVIAMRPDQPDAREHHCPPSEAEWSNCGERVADEADP
jgi:hypothetical protein